MRGFFLGFRVTIRNFVSIRTRSGNEYAGFLFRVPRDDSEFCFHTNTVRKRVCGFIFSDFGVYSRRSRFAGTLVLQPCAVLAVSSGALTGSSAALAVSSAALAVSSAALAGVQSRMFWTRFLITCET